MDMNLYLIEWWAKERLGELRAAMLREQIAEALRQKPPLRVVLGLALIGLGRRLQGNRAGTATPAAGTFAAF
jgi:hypothetical protein